MNLIQLEQTKNHYLLTIPQALMMRAKKIKPRQWDPSDSVWRYPRNKDTYQLLINEFDLKRIDEKAKRYGLTRSSLIKLFALNGELSINIDRNNFQKPIT